MVTSELARVDGPATLVANIRAAQLPPPRQRRRIREQAGVSLREMGAALGVNPMTVWRWEKGDADPTRSNAVAYRQLLEALEEVGA